MALILILDDSELILQMLEMICQQAGHDTITATSVTEAQQAYYSSSPPDVVISDLNLPDCEDPIADMKALGNAPVVIVSGRPQAELDQIAADKGAAGAVSKDAGMAGMTATLPDLLGRLIGS